MPSGKYYCDYCDKEFQDTLVARKRHLQSKPHLRAKSLWFSSLSDPNPRGPHTLPRGFCDRFVSWGFCGFGDSCKYLHPKHIPAGFTGSQTQIGLNIQRTPGSEYISGLSTTGWGDLPPSLQPAPESGYPRLPSVDWG
ncbi:PREDICTED: zinc finger CCCH domain-containing protein 3 isoform X2 [Tarenaya hassleriana]|uniref:zinc finger CCCH domain-containing protein 3 isoform X2 n=1 Tax=Tarenaya hassleriana TaxID=28532 RepID=UPI00053C64E2|nr:PREDICTED: zinc finger CCCH domain-containing protein 3 isoform X2 [Tarenaya hassleriana]